MKTVFLQIFGSIALAAVLTSCPETTVPDGFGAGPVGFKPEAVADWEGSWHPVDAPKETFTFQVKDAKMGILELREVSPSDPAKKPDVFTLTVRDTGVKTDEELYFAIVKEVTEAKDGTLYLMRPPKDGVLLLWGIDHDAVSAAIQARQLQGRTKNEKDGPHNALADSPEDYPKLLSPGFWKWTQPAVLVKAR